MSNRTPFLTIRAEGALLPVDLLQRIVENDPDLGGLTPESYHLSGEKLNEAINRSWNRLLGAWAAFSAGREKLPEGDPGTSVTREKWLLPLFDELDYGRLQITKAIEIEGKSYAISHGWDNVPIHLVGCGAELDRRMAGVTGAAKASPHSLVQELLNRSPERTWGFVSNGLRMRVLRDNASLTRQAYLEFDLEAMMNGEVYADFVVLWLVCHESRLESREQRVGADCWLEQWSKAAQERGTRALEGLRGGVEKAIEALGKGFIGHPANGSLRSALKSGAVSTLDLYRQLLRLVYRLIFLFVAEDRQLLYDPASDAEARKRYADYYSTARLRRMAERVRGSRHADLYVALKLVMDKLGNGGAPELGLPALGGFLFSRAAMSALADCELSNASLLEAVRSLAFTQDGRTRRAVDYKNLGSEELGSIYESLLELHPLVNTDAASFELTAVSGSERKTTGSYYTPSSLIQVLLDSALEPVIGQALTRAGASIENQQSAILNLKVVDPACGSGHFLVAAAHRLARRLASVRTGEGEPAPEAMRAALRSVISNCIYGVDINPMSVELCKVSLWMEALEPGKPLSFLDAHIQCGDSLVGVSPNLDISEIPDEAFNPAFGDDKATSTALKKRNKRERGGSHADKAGQLGFRFEVTHLTGLEDLARWLADRAAQVEAMPEDDSTQVQAKADAFDEYHASQEYLKNRLELDLWTAAFFWSIPKTDAESMLAPTQQELIQLRNGGELDKRLVERVKELAERLNFFHWKLAFPNVFSGENSGFDCVLGNPPWDQLQFREVEFFTNSNPDIALAKSGAIRKKLIDDLRSSESSQFLDFQTNKADLDNTRNFVQNSGRYPTTAVGRINTYALFAEGDFDLLSPQGYIGVIVPSGIATDDSTKLFFQKLMENTLLISLFDFENRKGIFPGVDSRYKFCLLTGTRAKSQKLSSNGSEFLFFAHDVEELRDSGRRFSLTYREIEKINPNTKTCPILRRKEDVDLLRKVYNQFPILIDENDQDGNPWGIHTKPGLFNMTHDSGLFITTETLKESGVFVSTNSYSFRNKNYVPLLEAKMVDFFDHRAAGVIISDTAQIRQGQPEEFSDDEHKDPNKYPTPRFWVSVDDIENSLSDQWDRAWLFGWKQVTSPTNERTLIPFLSPRIGVGHSLYVILFQNEKEHQLSVLASLLLANFSSLSLDYITRLKLGGVNLTPFTIKQLPVIPLANYTSADIDFIAPRVLELVYTAYDLRPFAEDMWKDSEQLSVGSNQSLRDLYLAQWEANRRDPESAKVLERFPHLKDASFPETPFIWNESRRAQLRAELDAYYARLYGLTRDELRYILDPKEVYGEDFPGETFRVLKEKEIKQFGEYRTRRLVLEAWDALEG